MIQTRSSNLTYIHERILLACQRTGRDPTKVRLVVVSKTRSAKEVRDVMEAGQVIFGENRVQEARDKIPLVNNPALQWHLIGPLQTNKVKTAVKLFHMIHSLDSLRLAEELSKEATPMSPMPVLLQINLGREPQKSGLPPENATEMIRRMALLPGIVIQGLMAIPPQTPSPEEARPWFRALAQLRDHVMENLKADHIDGVNLHELSMGMSHDYEIAVEEGATLVRIGSAVFNLN
ncbi:MAG: YggS family pyridoxal phosphate-dependent enzyme [Magnetococcus sp. YQC-5]